MSSFYPSDMSQLSEEELAQIPQRTFPFFPWVTNYFTDPAYYHVNYRPTAIRNSIVMYINYLPILFIFYCMKREARIWEYYKTTIIFSAYAQFIFTLPQTIFETWFSIAVSQNLKTTIFWCSMVKLNTGACTHMSYIAIVAVGFSRLISLVFNKRIGVGFVLVAFTFCCSLLVAIVAYMYAVNAVYPQEVCHPIIFFLEDIPAIIFNLWTFLIPLIALLLNIFTVAFLIYVKATRTHVSQSKKVDELVVAFSLLLQSAIPAVTIASKGFLILVQTWLVEAPEWFNTFTNWASVFTTGLNVLASIVFIKSFQDQFKALFWLPIKQTFVRPDPTTSSSVIHIKI